MNALDALYPKLIYADGTFALETKAAIQRLFMEVVQDCIIYRNNDGTWHFDGNKLAEKVEGL